MAKTIIQTIGPLYGEVVNGTVFGRPNGSVYVPSSNKISIVVPDGTTVSVNSAQYVVFSSPVKISAESQDIASNMYMAIYSDIDCTMQIGLGRHDPVGLFNTFFGNVGKIGTDTITDGTTYYVRAELMNSGSSVATSSVVAVLGVEE